MRTEHKIVCYVKKEGTAWVVEEGHRGGSRFFQHTSRQKAIAGILARHPGITSFTILIPAIKAKGEK